MEILLAIALIIAVIGAVIYGYLWLADQINQYCLGKYNYEPITLGKAFWVIIISVTLAISLAGIEKGKSEIFAVSLFISALITVLILSRIALKTSISIAAASALMLVIAAVLIVFLITLQILGSTDNRRRDDRW